MDSRLILFRRHDRACTEGYRKDARVFESDSLAATKKPQCKCPIYAEGTLRRDGNKKYIKQKNTGKNAWNEARRAIDNWIEWFGTEPPRGRPADSKPVYALVTVDQAIESFYMHCRGRADECSTARIDQYEQLLTLRFKPFAESKKIEFIQEMDNAKIWAEFRASWKNENPNRNRKTGPCSRKRSGGWTAAKQQDQPITHNYRARMTADLRAVLKFWNSREWLSDNWASKEHGMTTTPIIEQKDPFREIEEAYIYQAADLVPDGKGFRNRRTGQRNAIEDRIFAWTLRHTGLRVCDVTQLDVSQLVEFKNGRFTHAIYCNPQKTKKKNSNFVHIPIPNAHFADLGFPDLVSALISLPLKHGKYFFLGGGPLPARGTEEWKKRVKQAASRWEGRMNRLFRIARQLMGEDGLDFENPPHAHRFRHTFASRLLRKGATTRAVAKFLGDAEQTITNHYSKFCLTAQNEAAQELSRALLG
jgi:integrase